MKQYLYILIIISIYIFLRIYYSYINNSKLINYNLNITENFTVNNTNLNTDKFIINIKEFMSEWNNILDNYLNNFNNVNIISRNCKTLTELKDKYLLGINNITKSNISTFYNTLIELNTKYNDKLKLSYFNTNINIKIIKINNDYENGYPHTHMNYILLPNSWFNNPDPLTYIHEYCHVIQRFNPEIHYSLYKNWGFIKYDITKINGLENIIIRNRVNPDGLDINWIWKDPISDEKKYYWIGAVFNSEKPSSIADISYNWYKLDYKINEFGDLIFNYNDINVGSLNNLNNFKTYFGISNNHYHPNEIFAELIVNYFMENNNSKAINYLIKFLN